MEKIKASNSSIKSIIENNITENGPIITEENIYSIIHKVETLIEQNNELGFIEDIKEDILSIQLERKTLENCIIRKSNVDISKLRELTVKVLEILEEQNLVIVLEPNNNLYIDVDYLEIIDFISTKNGLQRFICILDNLELIQKTALVDENNNKHSKNYNDIYEKISQNADFQKNELVFNLMLKVISYLELMYKIYQ